jgi:hypothetical protein
MSASLRMGGFIPWANIAQGSRECSTTHSSTSATTGTFLSTVVAWSGQVRGQCDDSPQPGRAVDGNRHRRRARQHHRADDTSCAHLPV